MSGSGGALLASKSVFMGVVASLIIAPVAIFTAVMDFETNANHDLSGIKAELRCTAKKVRDKVCEQDAATAAFIDRTESDLRTVNRGLAAWCNYRIRCDPCKPSNDD